MHPFLTGVLTARVITAVTGMLIHSVWQGLLLSIVAMGMLQFLKKEDAAKRYLLLALVATMFLLACAATFMWKWNTAADTNTILFTNDLGAPFTKLFSTNLQGLRQLLKYGDDYLVAHGQWVFTAWLLVVLFKILKLATALVYNRRIKTRLIYQPDAYWKDQLSQLSKKLGIKKTVRLLQSGYCKIPVITGHLRPFILVPVGLLAGLPADQAEAILLHELAHIRRNDYLFNCVQSVVEALFFFNPGVWWLSTLLKEERENCCDDIVLSQTQNRKGLAAALISFKSYELNAGVFETAFPGRKKHLLRRVMRIVENRNTAMSSFEKLFFIGSIVLLGITGCLVLLANTGQTVIKPSVSEVRKISPFLQPGMTVIQLRDHPGKSISGQKKRAKAGMNTTPGRVLVKQAPAVMKTAVPALTEKQLMEQDKLQAERASQQALKDQQQAAFDQEQVMKAQASAAIDQEQAAEARQQAMLSQEKARNDQALAKINQQQAMIDQEQAFKEQVKAKIQQQKAIKDKKQAESTRLNVASF